MCISLREHPANRWQKGRGEVTCYGPRGSRHGEMAAASQLSVGYVGTHVKHVLGLLILYSALGEPAASVDLQQ